MSPARYAGDHAISYQTAVVYADRAERAIDTGNYQAATALAATATAFLTMALYEVRA